MPSIIGSAIAGSAALGAGASLIGSSKSSAAATNAANINAAAANHAADVDMQRYQQTRTDLFPYNAAGQNFLPGLQAVAMDTSGNNWLNTAASAMPTAADQPTLPTGMPTAADLPTMPGMMTQAQLEATPGYQFQLQQGLKATQSAAAARGLGVSGAALKGAAQYATGLADSNYQQQFANQQALFGNQQAIFGNKQQMFGNQEALFGNQQQLFSNKQTMFANPLSMNTAVQGNLTNLYNRLQGVVNTGENAAAQTGTIGAQLATNQANTGVQAAQNQGNALVQAGQAGAAGALGVGNAFTGAANSYLGYNLLKNYLPSAGNTAGFVDSGTFDIPQ